MDGTFPAPLSLAATPTATGDSIRDVLIAAVRWSHENERLYFRVGRQLVEALVDVALMPGDDGAAKRLKGAVELVDQYFDACHSTDGKRIAKGLRSSLEILAANGFWNAKR